MTNSIDETKVLTQIALFCRRAFEQNPEGRQAAAKLGLTDERLSGRFRVGYANEALLTAVPSEGAVRATLQILGILSAEGALTISGCLVVPILDREGAVTGITAIDGEGRERRFPTNASLCGLNPVNISNRSAVFVESVTQALRYIQAGVSGVVALGAEPGEPEKAFLNINRPQKAYCDAAGPALPAFLQKLEIPCFRLSVSWPATLADINAAMKSPESIETKVGEAATVRVLDDSIQFLCSGRQYELTDLDPATADRLRVRLRASKSGSFHLDTLDLYAARSRVGFARHAAALFQAHPKEIEADLCLMIRKIEAIHEAEQRKRLEPSAGYVMTSDEEAEALHLLRQPGLFDRVVADMGRLGYVGEAINKKLGYLIAVSRKLESPLCAAILSRAGAGKSSLMDVLADMTPPEEISKFTRITPQALYYAGRKGLRHKLLMCGEDEGLMGSDYALRELISSKHIRLAAPLNDSESGKFRTVEYEVEGPIALLFSTTRPAIHFENATRCFTISLDESREQTKGILEEQRRRRTIARVDERAVQDDLRRLHRNAQRLLKPLVVVNPFAPHLEFPTQPLEMRREQEKYLTLIDTIALLHQHQRERKIVEANGRRVEYIEASVDDIEEANKLMTAILGASSEELSRPSRELLGHIRRMAQERAMAAGVEPHALRFNRRDIREYTGWSDSQVKSHIGQLEELEYLLISKGERGRMYRYELAPDSERKRLPGLTDAARLRAMVRKSGMGGYGLVGSTPRDCVENSNLIMPQGPKVGQFPERAPGVGVHV